MKNKIILGIETSCDETSLALIINDKLIDELTTSSANVQTNFGGVVPEIATRYHQNNIHLLLQSILVNNNLTINDLTHIVYTQLPGLPGCLHVGACFAKTLANLLNIELIGVNHLYGHLFSPYIDSIDEPKFPILGLIISGGHTTIYLANSYTNIHILNETRDDAVGEVYDKVARKLGLGYPGGPKIDKLFDLSKNNINFLKNNLPENEQFSFSGIKTSVLNYINTNKQNNIGIDIVEVATSFQKTIIDDVIKKLKYQLKQYPNINEIAVGGGVAANNYLRNELIKIHPNVLISPLKYTGDQASMIVHYGSKLIE